MQNKSTFEPSAHSQLTQGQQYLSNLTTPPNQIETQPASDYVAQHQSRYQQSTIPADPLQQQLRNDQQGDQQQVNEEQVEYEYVEQQIQEVEASQQNLTALGIYQTLNTRPPLCNCCNHLAPNHSPSHQQHQQQGQQEEQQEEQYEQQEEVDEGENESGVEEGEVEHVYVEQQNMEQWRDDEIICPKIDDSDSFALKSDDFNFIGINNEELIEADPNSNFQPSPPQPQLRIEDQRQADVIPQFQIKQEKPTTIKSAPPLGQQQKTSLIQRIQNVHEIRLPQQKIQIKIEDAEIQTSLVGQINPPTSQLLPNSQKIQVVNTLNTPNILDSAISPISSNVPKKEAKTGQKEQIKREQSQSRVVKKVVKRVIKKSTKKIAQNSKLSQPSFIPNQQISNTLQQSYIQQSKPQTHTPINIIKTQQNRQEVAEFRQIIQPPKLSQTQPIASKTRQETQTITNVLSEKRQEVRINTRADIESKKKSQVRPQVRPESQEDIRQSTNLQRSQQTRQIEPEQDKLPIKMQSNVLSLLNKKSQQKTSEDITEPKKDKKNESLPPPPPPKPAKKKKKKGNKPKQLKQQESSESGNKRESGNNKNQIRSSQIAPRRISQIRSQIEEQNDDRKSIVEELRDPSHPSEPEERNMNNIITKQLIASANKPTQLLTSLIIVKEAEKQRVGTTYKMFLKYNYQYERTVLNYNRIILDIFNQLCRRREQKRPLLRILQQYFEDFSRICRQYNERCYKIDTQDQVVSPSSNKFANLRLEFKKGFDEMIYIRKSIANNSHRLNTYINNNVLVNIRKLFDIYHSSIAQEEGRQTQRRQQYLRKAKHFNKVIHQLDKSFARGLQGKFKDDLFVQIAKFINQQKIHRAGLQFYGRGIIDLRNTFIKWQKQLFDKLQEILNNFKVELKSIYCFGPRQFGHIVDFSINIKESIKFDELCTLTDLDYMKYVLEIQSKKQTNQFTMRKFQNYLDLIFFDRVVGNIRDMLKGATNKVFPMQSEHQQLIHSISGNLVLFNRQQDLCKDKYEIKNLNAKIVEGGFVEFDELIKGFIFDDNRTIRLKLKDEDRAEELICYLNQKEEDIPIDHSRR